jgi:hypothetical protein
MEAIMVLKGIGLLLIASMAMGVGLMGTAGSE